MTTITFHRIGEVEIRANNRVLTVPTLALGFDSDLREVVAQAMDNPGVAVSVPSTARMPQPKYKKVYGVQL